MQNTKKKFPIKLFWTAAILAAIYFSARLYFNLTDDFRIANMTYELPHHSEWEIAMPSPAEQQQLDAVLDQPFYYIGKGAQSYAFHSKDDQYVIKFFKFKHLKPHWFMEILPPIPPIAQYKKKQAIRKERKLYGVFASYHLAYEVHRPESGLLFLHLNKTQNLNKTITIVDKVGLSRQISLDDVVFIIQEKARTTRSVLDEALKNGNISLAKQRLNQIINLYASEYRKGIFDKDHGVMHNTGFVGDRPIHLDVGKMIVNEDMKNPQVAEADFKFVVERILRWIDSSYPQAYPELHQEIQDQMTNIFGHPVQI